MTKTYKIKAIIKRSKRHSKEYLEDCKNKALSWDEESGIATFNEDDVATIKDNVLNNVYSTKWDKFESSMMEHGSDKGKKELARFKKWLEHHNGCGCAGKTKIKKARQEFMDKHGKQFVL